MRLVILMSGVVCLASSAFADPHSVFGTFLTEDGESHIEIVDCGNGSPCGRVVWVDPTSIEDGTRPEDLKTRLGEDVLGLQILEGFTRKKRDWRGGTIYSPEENKTYSSRLKRKEDGSLQVKGCVGPLCQTQVWAAVDASTGSSVSE